MQPFQSPKDAPFQVFQGSPRCAERLAVAERDARDLPGGDQLGHAGGHVAQGDGGLAAEVGVGPG